MVPDTISPVITKASSPSCERSAFRPRRFLSGGHVQTIASFLLPRRFSLATPEERLVEVEPGVCVLCHCHWQPERQSPLTVIVVHGLEGSSESKYMMGIAEKGLAAGMNVVRMNQRTCGGTDGFAATLYHSGRSADVVAVARHLIEKCKTDVLDASSVRTARRTSRRHGAGSPRNRLVRTAARQHERGETGPRPASLDNIRNWEGRHTAPSPGKG